MEQFTFEQKLKFCLQMDDMNLFKEILEDLKKEEPFSAALYLAQGFSLDWKERYNEYFKVAVETNLEWATVLHEEYGQPLFREIFAVGAKDCLDAYLNAVGKEDKGFLQSLYLFAVSWNEDYFKKSELLPEKYPFEILKGDDRVILIGDIDDFEEINDLVRSHDILARQRLMLLKLESLL